MEEMTQDPGVIREARQHDIMLTVPRIGELLECGVLPYLK
jgi:hypothetical protein